MEKNHCKLANAALRWLANAPHRAVEHAAEKKVGSGGMAATFGLSLDDRDPGVGDDHRRRLAVIPTLIHKA